MKKLSRRTTTRRDLPLVVVAGDVCIDWLSVPVEPVIPKGLPDRKMNWQLRGGRHMYALRGGAWLTADFVKVAVGRKATVAMPQSIARLENVPPDSIIHSMLTLERGKRRRDCKDVHHWVVSRFDGFAGPPPGSKPRVLPVADDNSDADLVVLDDAGNGFRDEVEHFPRALIAKTPWVLYKVRRPLAEGALWSRLASDHLERTVALLSADELRGEGASISRRLSWERSATDLVLSLAREPRFTSLRRCPFLIVPLGIEGAVLLTCGNGQVDSAHLWYLPQSTEGELLDAGYGHMSGFGSVFTAAIAAAIVRAGHPATLTRTALVSPLHEGVRTALHAMNRLLDEAYGPCESEDSEPTRRLGFGTGPVPAPSLPQRRAPAYPVDRTLFERMSLDYPICDVRLPGIPAGHDAKQTAAYRSWRILDSKRTQALEELATKVVLHGVDEVLSEIPIGRFGKKLDTLNRSGFDKKLDTLDRSEIESYRAIRNLIQEFCRNPKPDRPLCLAVFGPPGGGKSFGVTQVALGVSEGAPIEPIEFNVSQWENPNYLIQALHCVRDHALRGKIPLVFFDEFDSELGGHELAWLKFFLAPMQDGVFMDGLNAHQIGKAILIFAGGTARTYAEFRRKVDNALEGQSAQAAPAIQASSQETKMNPRSVGSQDRGKSKSIDVKNTKQPDFLSRLRGHVDVYGVNPPADTNLLRRALVLRANICKKYPSLLDASGVARIDGGVLRAFLGVSEYLHGARSVEAILEMSQLVGRTHFDPSLLPPAHQLELHVDGAEFMALVQSHQALGANLERIAEEIHKLYLQEEQKKGARLGARPSLNPWPKLDDLYRNSSREQAAHYPLLLAAVGCRVVEGPGDPDLDFSPEELDRLARMEHERWCEERRIKQPDHADLRPWEALAPKEKDKDVRSVRAIPRILAKVGLGVRRLEIRLPGTAPGDPQVGGHRNRQKTAQVPSVPPRRFRSTRTTAKHVKGRASKVGRSQPSAR